MLPLPELPDELLLITGGGDEKLLPLEILGLTTGGGVLILFKLF